MKKYLSYLGFLPIVVICCFTACQGQRTDSVKESKIAKDEYSEGLVDLSIDTIAVKSALHFLNAGAYNESDGYGTITLNGLYAGLPTKWAITFKSNKAVIVSFDYSTPDTTAAAIAHIQSWVTNLKSTVTRRYGQPWKDSLHTISPEQDTPETVIWRKKIGNSSDEEIILLSLSSDSYEHTPFTKHYDIQFKHFYVSDAPKWYMTMIE